LSDAPRVALIGARRRRQGLGPFVARELAAAGARVAGLLTTSPATARQAEADLIARFGIRARGYTDLATLLAGERPDALAILAPPETHERYLRAALDAGLHALCEKPLVWGRGMAARARELVDGFAARGLVLVENCQWPYTLPAFAALHPGALDRPPTRFEMWLTPRTRGLEMLRDSLSHPLSLLQALGPGCQAYVRNVELEAIGSARGIPDADALRVRFEYLSGAAQIGCRVELTHGDAEPRAAGYAVNGLRARRLVEPADYSLAFVDAGRSVPVRDPLTASIEAFVSALRAALGGKAPPRAHEIARRMELLESLAGAFPEEGT
jgi:predicted dehydrogenase